MYCSTRKDIALQRSYHVVKKYCSIENNYTVTKTASRQSELGSDVRGILTELLHAFYSIINDRSQF